LESGTGGVKEAQTDPPFVFPDSFPPLSFSDNSFCTPWILRVSRTKGLNSAVITPSSFFLPCLTGDVLLFSSLLKYEFPFPFFVQPLSCVLCPWSCFCFFEKEFFPCALPHAPPIWGQGVCFPFLAPIDDDAGIVKLICPNDFSQGPASFF